MSKFEFNYNTTDLDLLNALRLAESSHLVYESQDKIQEYLNNKWGLSKFNFFNEHETQAFICSNNDVVILAFRGTDSWADWKTDFNADLIDSKVGRVHEGFNKALDYVWANVEKTVSEYLDQKQTFWVTGHSLGGALATLAVDRFTENGISVSGMYTFGQPKAGDRKFAQNFDDKMKERSFRFVHDEDVVPKAPPLLSYCHIGNECYFDNKGVLHREKVWWYRLLSRSESVEVRSRKDLSDLRGQYPGGFRDHSLNYYIRFIQQNLKESKPAEPGQQTFSDYINKRIGKG